AIIMRRLSDSLGIARRWGVDTPPDAYHRERLPHAAECRCSRIQPRWCRLGVSESASQALVPVPSTRPPGGEVVRIRRGRALSAAACQRRSRNCAADRMQSSEWLPLPRLMASRAFGGDRFPVLYLEEPGHPNPGLLLAR